MAELERPYVEPVKPPVRTFVTSRNSDLTEGRGHCVFEKYFDDVHEAVAAAKGIDVQGTDGEVYEIITLLPDQKKLVWGRTWINELSIYYTGFTPDSEWFDDSQIKERVKQTQQYKEYAVLKKKFERYGL